MSDTPAPNDPHVTNKVKSPVDARDRAVGLGLIAVSFVVALGISARAKEASMPVVASDPAPPSTAGIVGFPSAVKPLPILDNARKLTSREQLVGMAIVGAKPDGTIDLQASGQVRYAFRSAEGKGPQPRREYGELALRKYCGFQIVTLTGEGLGAQADVSNADCKRAIEALPPPTCSVEQLWELAKQQGVDPQGTAAIDYYRATSGPAWYFESAATSFTVAPDCKTLLSDQERVAVIAKRVPG